MAGLLAAVAPALSRPVENARGYFGRPDGEGIPARLVNLILLRSRHHCPGLVGQPDRNNWSAWPNPGIDRAGYFAGSGSIRADGLAGLTTLLGTRIGPAKSHVERPAWRTSAVYWPA